MREIEREDILVNSPISRGREVSLFAETERNNKLFTQTREGGRRERELELRSSTEREEREDVSHLRSPMDARAHSNVKGK